MIDGQGRRVRTDESLSAEVVTRDQIVLLLARHGFTGMSDLRTVRGTSVSQVVTAVDPDGVPIKLHVRLCWRRGRNPREQEYSAAQLRTRRVGEDWEKTLDYIAGREAQDGNTHNLIVQYDRSDFVYAAF